MTFKEVFDKTELVNRDTKARRRVNVSNDVASVTAEQIEAGITIEAIENIGVPVFLYGGQITIHGKLPGFESDRVLGYKALFQNGNGSIGVKYIAIDGEKKELIMAACRACENPQMYAGANSSEFYLQKTVADRAAAAALLATLPDCFIGNKYGAMDVYGRFYAVVELSAIYQADLFTFIKWLAGFESAEQITAAQAYKNLKREQDNTASAAKWKIERAAQIAVENKIRAELEPLYKWVVNPESGIFYHLSFYDGKPRYNKVEYKKRGNTLLKRSDFDRDTLAEAKESMLYGAFKKIVRRADKEYKYIAL